MSSKEPSISQTVDLTFIGDWGGANFHRICSWLTQEFCDRAGPGSRTAILSIRDGGLDALQQVRDGKAHLALSTPANLLRSALTGEGFFASQGPMPNLRTLAVLPQRDRMMLAIDPKYGISSIEDLHRVRPPIRIATSIDDGTNYIGYVARRLMEAHGVSEDTLRSWGGEFVYTVRPEQAVANVESGKADALLQEAIMTPWWRDLIDLKKLRPVPFTREALAKLKDENGFEPATMPANYWKHYNESEILAADFSDFLVVVRDDLPDDIAFLLTWCLVETRGLIESQYRHLRPERSPLTYPLDPVAMAKSSIPLHPSAKRYYRENGYLE